MNLDITWLRDETLEDLDNLPAPEIIAREIVEDLTAALEEFAAVADALEAASGLRNPERGARPMIQLDEDRSQYRSGQ